MQAFESYKTAKAPARGGERLPAGGYVLIIKSAEEVRFDGGRKLRISFDIAEGEYKDFYANNYRAQRDEDKKWKGSLDAFVPKEDGSEKDGWTASAFKGTTEALEGSNPGYHWDWDEKKLKGKVVGGVFGNKEYEINGSRGFFTDCRFFVSADDIRAGKFKLPKDKLLKSTSSQSQSAVFRKEDFMDIEVDEKDLPF